MPRFTFTILLLLLVVGCQTATRGPQPTILVNSSKPVSPIKKFWSKTAQFIQPLMPDRGKYRAETESTLAADAASPDILPINRTPHSLYQAGSIFPTLSLISQASEVAVTAETAATETAANVAPVSPNPQQIRAGDSEAFKSLLREIAIMPPEKRKVDDARLAEMLTAFRDEIMNSDFEAEYLVLLRRRILPEAKSAAPLPNTELAEIKRSPRGTKWDDDEYIYEEPIVRHAPRRTPPHNDEPVIAQNSVPMTAPVYPSLVQLPGGIPAATQASYQSQSVTPPPVLNLTGHGAGDWQAPTRVAIEQLRYAIEHTPNGRTVSNEMRLRMLEMLLGNQAEAVRPMQSADKVVNDFLGHQVLGLAALLDDSMRDNRNRYVSAVYRFSEGLQELQNICPIKLKNVAFVENWLAYGQFIPRNAQDEFHPGDDFLVYIEIEHPAVRRIPDGYEVSVAISYEIRDAHANIVVRQDMGKPTERSLSRKRDYALAFPGTIPASFAPGQYQLRINVTDLNDDSMQYAEEQIPFRIAPSVATGR